MSPRSKTQPRSHAASVAMKLMRGGNSERKDRNTSHWHRQCRSRVYPALYRQRSEPTGRPDCRCGCITRGPQRSARRSGPTMSRDACAQTPRDSARASHRFSIMACCRPGRSKGFSTVRPGARVRVELTATSQSPRGFPCGMTAEEAVESSGDEQCIAGFWRYYSGQGKNASGRVAR